MTGVARESWCEVEGGVSGNVENAVARDFRLGVMSLRRNTSGPAVLEEYRASLRRPAGAGFRAS